MIKSLRVWRYLRSLFRRPTKTVMTESLKQDILSGKAKLSDDGNTLTVKLPYTPGPIKGHQMTYSDKYGEFFGRLDERGNVCVLHVEDGLPATRLDASVYPI